MRNRSNYYCAKLKIIMEGEGDKELRNYLLWPFFMFYNLLCKLCVFFQFCVDFLSPALQYRAMSKSVNKYLIFLNNNSRMLKLIKLSVVFCVLGQLSQHLSSPRPVARLLYEFSHFIIMYYHNPYMRFNLVKSASQKERWTRRKPVQKHQFKKRPSWNENC